MAITKFVLTISCSFEEEDALKNSELWECIRPDYPFAKLPEDWIQVTLQSFEYGQLGATKAQKDVGEVMVGQ
jgi:hypothetical protein